MNYYNAAMKDKIYTFDNTANLPSDITENMWRDCIVGDLSDIWLGRFGFLPVEIANYKAGKTVNWNDMVFQTGKRQDHNISLSGKKDEVSYYGSIGYNKNEGVIVGDDFTTIRARLNVDANITKWLNVGISTQFANRDESNINADWSKIVSNSPYGSIYMDDGITLRISPVDDLGRGAKHPLYDKMFQTRRKTYNTLINTLFANVKLPLGITYQMNFAPRYEWYSYLNHQSAIHEEWAKFGGQADREQKNIYSWQVDNLLKWNKTFNKHQIDVTLLANAEKFQSWRDRMSTQGFTPTDALGYHNMTAGKSTSNVINSTDEYNTGNALMARLFYSFNNRYMVTLSARRDGYSAFGQKHPYGTFPAAAFAWVLSEENFMKSNILTFAKLRFSWGMNGNREIGMYDALSDMNIGKYPYQSVSGTAYESNQLYVNRMANPDLRWEKTESMNFGFDFTITNGFLDGSIEYYRKNTKDLLIARGLPVFTGFSSVTSNIGEIQNAGFEATLNGRIINKQNFGWTASANFSLNRNQIKHLYGDMIDVVDANGNVTGQREADDLGNKWFIGHDIDQIWEPRILGVWQIGEEEQAKVFGQYPGDFRLLDVDNSGKINNLDNEFQGYRTPRFRWTFRQEFTLFKNWNVSMMAYSYWGHYGGYNQAKNRDGFPERVNSYKVPYWTPENSTNEYARIYSAEGGANFTVWRERSFIRFDNITVSYNVSQSLLKKVNVNSLKVFGTIRNIGFWAPHWDFWDPEQYRDPFNLDSSGNPNLVNGPSPRIYTVGINISL
jgi:TonB-linked SusC/RagA family outer membrane protein